MVFPFWNFWSFLLLWLLDKRMQETLQQTVNHFSIVYAFILSPVQGTPFLFQHGRLLCTCSLTVQWIRWDRNIGLQNHVVFCGQKPRVYQRPVASQKLFLKWKRVASSREQGLTSNPRHLCCDSLIRGCHSLYTSICLPQTLQIPLGLLDIK